MNTAARRLRAFHHSEGEHMAAKKKLGPGATDALMSGGEERAQGDRWSQDQDTVGSVLLGRMVSTHTITFADGKEGEALVFSPAVVRSAEGEITTHRVIETIFSEGLKSRITPATDKGVVLGIQHTGFEKSKKPGRNAFKTYRVVAQNPDVLVKQLRDEGADELVVLVRAGSE